MQEYNPDLRHEELIENPELKKQIVYKNGMSLDGRNVAQLINTYEYTNRWGHERSVVTGNTKIGRNIDNLPVNNFGCISEMNIYTLPASYLSRAGIEKTSLNQINKSYKGIDLISRRFASLIVREIGYIHDLKYIDDGEHSDVAVKMLCREDKFQGKKHHYINGKELRELILILIDEIRDNNIKCFYEYDAEVNNPFIADRIVVLKVEHHKGNRKETTIVNEYIKSWTFPRYNMEYLIGLLQELNSKNYYMDVDIPIIYNLYDYPIKCTDTHLKPTTDAEHMKAKDDYDLGQYIWEDY